MRDIQEQCYNVLDLFFSIVLGKLLMVSVKVIARDFCASITTKCSFYDTLR